MGLRLKGNDKVALHQRRELMYIKAFQQGVEFGCPHWWPALTSLTIVEQQVLRTMVVNYIVWNAGAPRYTVDGRRFA